MNIEKLKEIDPDIDSYDPEYLQTKINMIDSETRFLNNELRTVVSETALKSKLIADNSEKIKLNAHLPYLVGSVTEIFNEADGSSSGIVTSSTRQSSYLDMIGLVPAKDLKPGDPVALHKETNIVFEKLPISYDSKVIDMEFDGTVTETYEDIGGLDRQMEELKEAIVQPLMYAERFKNLNIQAPKGVLMYGPPGTGKTLMARACAGIAKTSFIKVAAPQFVQMYIGDGARLVRETFLLAKEKAPTIIFIDEIDAIGTKRSSTDQTGDREVQRTMLELLNELDGFSSTDNVKIIAATNRVDILDPALLRSGRLDRKIEFPLPNFAGRKRIFQIHSRKMSIHESINFDEIARSTEGFNGAQCKAVCTEAGMSAVKENRNVILQTDFINGINETMARKKSKEVYFT